MDDSQHDSEEFDIEGAIFQEKDSRAEKKKQIAGNASTHFDTDLVMRDAYGRQVGRK